jgi:hypothetical protein
MIGKGLTKSCQMRIYDTTAKLDFLDGFEMDSVFENLLSAWLTGKPGLTIKIRLGEQKVIWSAGAERKGDITCAEISTAMK